MLRRRRITGRRAAPPAPAAPPARLAPPAPATRLSRDVALRAGGGTTDGLAFALRRVRGRAAVHGTSPKVNYVVDIPAAYPPSQDGDALTDLPRGTTAQTRRRENASPAAPERTEFAALRDELALLNEPPEMADLVAGLKQLPPKVWLSATFQSLLLESMRKSSYFRERRFSNAARLGRFALSGAAK